LAPRSIDASSLGDGRRTRRDSKRPKQSTKLSTGPLPRGNVEAHKQILLGFQRDVFNKSDWSIPTLAKYLKPNIIDHNAFVGDPPGLEGVQSRFSLWKSAFNEATEAYHAMVGEGDKLAVLYDLHAQHTGAYLGVGPTNRAVTIPGIELLRYEDGMMAEHWGLELGCASFTA
jgi:predicted ester cyclase